MPQADNKQWKGKAEQTINILLGDGAYASYCPAQGEGLFPEKDSPSVFRQKFRAGSCCFGPGPVKGAFSSKGKESEVTQMG